MDSIEKRIREAFFEFEKYKLAEVPDSSYTHNTITIDTTYYYVIIPRMILFNQLKKKHNLINIKRYPSDTIVSHGFLYLMKIKDDGK